MALRKSRWAAVNAGLALVVLEVAQGGLGGRLGAMQGVSLTGSGALDRLFDFAGELADAAQVAGVHPHREWVGFQRRAELPRERIVGIGVGDEEMGHGSSQ
jgi:hypothetical protein